MTSTTKQPDGGVSLVTLVAGYAVAAAAVLWLFGWLPTVVLLPVALPLLLFAPGYAVVSALYPDTHRSGADDEGGRWAPGPRPSLSPGERAVLAVVVSIAAVPIVAILGGVVGLTGGPILALLAVVTVLAAAVARLRLPTRHPRRPTPREAYRDAAAEHLGGTRSLLWTSRSTQAAVAITVVLLLASASVAVTGGSDGGATEFYVAEADGLAAAAVDADATATVDLRVIHHGPTAQAYTIVVAYDEGGSASSQPSADDLVERDRLSTTVGPDETAAVTARTTTAGLATPGRLYLLLYEGDAPDAVAPASAHRTLRLSVNAST